MHQRSHFNTLNALNTYLALYYLHMYGLECYGVLLLYCNMDVLKLCAMQRFLQCFTSHFLRSSEEISAVTILSYSEINSFSGFIGHN